MSDWVSLRAHVEQLVAGWISAESDPEARAVLAYHQDQITDRVELVMLRAMLAGEEEPKPNGNGLHINGKSFSGNGRVIRVAPRA
jgi:hypothetical protein